MGKDELYKELSDSLKDEHEDAAKYERLSKEAGDDRYAQMLRDIAHEEHTHARHIREILSDMGMPDTEGTEPMPQKAQKEA